MAGDVEVFDAQQNLVEAYEITLRPDWKNRKPDLRKKMDKFGLERYHVICIIPESDVDLNSPENLARYMSELGRDISVVDFRSFVAVVLVLLTRDQRRDLFTLFQCLVLDRKLCGVPDYIGYLQSEFSELEL